VVRDAAASQNLSLDRYDLMRGLQQGAQPTPSPVLRLEAAPILPPIAPGPTPAAAPTPR
jgi:general secretion pathway protein D